MYFVHRFADLRFAPSCNSATARLCSKAAGPLPSRTKSTFAGFVYLFARGAVEASTSEVAQQFFRWKLFILPWRKERFLPSLDANSQQVGNEGLASLLHRLEAMVALGGID